MVKLGLVGTGRIGQVHLATLVRRVAGAHVVAVTDADLKAAQRTASQFSLYQVCSSFEDLLTQDLDAVVICSSTPTHVPFIVQAARAGKHIFCEKPIATELAAIDEALEAVQKAGVKLMIGFNRRFDANHRRIKAVIDSGQIGWPHRLHIVSRDPAPPPIEYVRASGGIFMDMTIHDFDMARFLLGEVDEVYAAAGVMVDPRIGEAGDVDTAVVTLRFDSGAIGTIDNSRRAAYGYDQRVEVTGSLGRVHSENLFPDEVTVSTAEHVARGLPLNFFMDRYLPAYQAEMEAFVDCIAHDRPSPVNGADGRAPVVLALAARRSLRDNRPVRVRDI